MARLAGWILDALRNHENESVLARLKTEVEETCLGFPVPGLPQASPSV